MKKVMSWLSFLIFSTWSAFVIFLLVQEVIYRARGVEVSFIYPGSREVFGVAMLVIFLLLPILLTQTKPWNLKKATKE